MSKYNNYIEITQSVLQPYNTTLYYNSHLIFDTLTIICRNVSIKHNNGFNIVIYISNVIMQFIRSVKDE